ncbi:hypothetical protein ACOI1H_14905 [Loktanella sp. DJP18]|uniref:hypothetical protein n=1 Tax=Loktanella sp. DJP18 TaxID=3409788 RepID=UPI003BB605CB
MTDILSKIPDPDALLSDTDAEMLGVDDWQTEESILDILESGIDAWSKPKTIDRIVGLMARVPLFVDAYVALADPDLFPRDYLTILDRGILAGEAYIEANCMKPISWWGDIKTRGYMRAKAKRAQHHIDRGEIDPALVDLHDLLDCNPSDNQGIRMILIATLINDARWNEADAAIRLYGNDEALARYARVMISWKAEYVDGRSDLALKLTEAALKHALALNAVVPAAISEPEAFGDSNGFLRAGGASEAIWVAQALRPALDANPEAPRWIWFATLRILQGELGQHP